MRLPVFVVLAALSTASTAAFAQSIPRHGVPVAGSIYQASSTGAYSSLWNTPGAEAQNAAAPKFHIDSQRLQGTLEKLSEFGRNPEGGVTRLGYSDTELAAHDYVIRLMKQAGLEVRRDPAGNLFGKRTGSENLPVLLFGSHIDSVVKGGNFDGDVGSLGAIEVIHALNEGAVETRHPLEVVIWTNEEGNHFGISTMGSGIAAGLVGPEILERKDDQGLTVADWLRRYGQDPAHLTDARIARGALAGYLELHIEQGPNLDEAKIPSASCKALLASNVGAAWPRASPTTQAPRPWIAEKMLSPPPRETSSPCATWCAPKPAAKSAPLAI